MRGRDQLSQTIAAEVESLILGTKSLPKTPTILSPFRAWMDLGRFTQGGTRWREFALGYSLSGFRPLRIEDWCS